MTKENVILMLIILLSVMFIAGIIYLITQNLKTKKMFGSKSIYKNQAIDKIYAKVYTFLKEFPISRNNINKLSYRYRLISPCDSKTICRKTINTYIITIVISLLSFMFIYMQNKSLNTVIRLIFIIIIIFSETTSRMLKYYQINILDEIEKLIDEVIHYYYIEYRVDDAIYRAKDHVSKNMKVVIEQIYELLLSDDKETALREYYENIPNKYLRAFVSQCISIIEKGDQELNGKLLFVRNMENLKREIDIEREKLEKINIEFYGVILCVISPIFCIEIVKEFAVTLKENMIAFYYGSKGFIFEMLLLMSITLIYIVLRKSAEYKTFYQSKNKWLYKIDKGIIKKALDNYCDKYASKIDRLKKELRNNGHNIQPRHFILRNIIISGIVFIISISIALYLIQLNKSNLLNVDKSGIITSAFTNEIQAEKTAKIIEEYTKRYTINKENFPDENKLREEIKSENELNSEIVINLIINEISNRVKEYDNQKFTFVMFFMCFCLSIITYYIPTLYMKYNSIVTKEAIEDEVNQFNAIISMLMYKDGMTVKQILEELESFAVIFKNSIKKCINDYSSGDIQALKELKENEPYEPFRRIVDNLIRCDDMPINKAFEEINIDHESYITKRKLANEKSLKKRVFRAYIIAAIPFTLLFIYGILPLAITAFKEINELLYEMQNMSW